MGKINDNSYVYASTRIRAAGGVGTEKERIDRLLDSVSVAAVASLITDSGLVPPGTGAGESVTSLLGRALDYAASIVVESSPDPSIYSFLFYKYDCCNLKLEIKSRFKGSLADGLYFSCGTVSPDDAAASVRERSFGIFPPHMAAAASEAIDSYERTGDARVIDFVLDRACFADAADNADKSGVPFFKEYTAAAADTTNLLTSARIADSGVAPSVAGALLSRVFLPGGNVKLDTLLSPEGGASSFQALAEKMDVSPLKTVMAEITSFDDAGRLYAGYLRSLTAKYDFKSFGPEIPACFFISREREITCFRKAVSLISAGIVGRDRLRERLGIAR